MEGWQDFTWGMSYHNVIECIRLNHPDLIISYILTNNISIAFSRDQFAIIPLAIGYFRFDNLLLYAVDFIFKPLNNDEEVIDRSKRLGLMINKKVGKGQVIYEGIERRSGKRDEIMTGVDVPDYYSLEFSLKVWTIGRTHILLSYAVAGKHAKQIYLRYLDKYHSNKDLYK